MSEQLPFDKSKVAKAIEKKQFTTQHTRQRTEPDTMEGVGRTLRDNDADMLLIDSHPLSPVSVEKFIKLHDRELGEVLREFTWSHFKVDE